MFKNIFTSSTGEGLAKRWETFFSGLIPAIVVISSFIPGANLTEGSLSELNTLIVTLISSVVVIWKVVEHINGWVRRNFNKKNKLGKFA